MSDFNYVGNQVYHISNGTTSTSSETLYLLLVSLNKAIEDGDSNLVILLRKKIEISNIQTTFSKIDYILKLILSKIIGTDSYSVLMYQLTSEYILDNSAGKDVSMSDLFTKLEQLGIDFSNEIILYNEYVNNTVQKGNSDTNIQIIADKILAIMSPDDVIQNISDGAQTNILHHQSLSELQALIAEFSNTNYSLDYILSILKSRMDSALASLRKANALMIANMHNSMGNRSLSGYLNYGNNSSDLQDSNTFGILAIIRDSSKQLLSQVYSASDYAIPNRLELSEGLSDLTHTTDSTIFLMNYECNLSLITNSHMNIYLYLMSIGMINMNFTTFDANYQEIMMSLMPRITSGTLEYNLNHFNLGMNGISKTNNHVPFDKEIIGSIKNFMDSVKNRIDAFSAEINNFFLSGAGSVISVLNNIIDKLNQILSSAFGSVVKIITEIMNKIKAVIAILNSILCIIKAFLCAVASMVKTILKAVSMAISYYNTFMEMEGRAEKALSDLSDMKDQFMGDSNSDLTTTFKNGISSINGIIIGKLEDMGLSADLVDQAKNALSGCSDTASILAPAQEAVSTYVDEQLNKAYQGVVNTLTSALNCPAMKIPLGDFTLPKIKDINKLKMPALNLNLNVGC